MTSPIGAAQTSASYWALKQLLKAEKRDDEPNQGALAGSHFGCKNAYDDCFYVDIEKWLKTGFISPKYPEA